MSPVPHAYVHLYCFLILSTLLLVSSSVPPYLLHHLFLICHSSINHPSCPQISSIGLPLPLRACPVDHRLSPPSVRLRLHVCFSVATAGCLPSLYTYIYTGLCIFIKGSLISTSGSYTPNVSENI